jgi:alpha-D-xyloside xylohydrolase
MRPLVMDFAADTAATHQAYEYSFEPAFLVGPVTKPGVTEWPVYLPKAAAWYNFWTGQRHTGGQTVPVFVKAGAIVPLGKRQQHTGQKSGNRLKIRVYPAPMAGLIYTRTKATATATSKVNTRLLPLPRMKSAIH